MSIDTCACHSHKTSDDGWMLLCCSIGCSIHLYFYKEAYMFMYKYLIFDICNLILDLGLRQPRLEGDEYLSIVDEFMEATFARWPKAVIQVYMIFIINA